MLETTALPTEPQHLPYEDINTENKMCTFQPTYQRQLTTDHWSLSQMISMTKGRLVIFVTRLGDLLDFGQFFKAFGNN